MHCTIETTLLCVGSGLPGQVWVKASSSLCLEMIKKCSVLHLEGCFELLVTPVFNLTTSPPVVFSLPLQSVLFKKKQMSLSLFVLNMIPQLPGSVFLIQQIRGVIQ